MESRRVATQTKIAESHERGEVRLDHEASRLHQADRRNCLTTKFPPQGKMLELTFDEHALHPGLEAVSRKKAGGIQPQSDASVCSLCARIHKRPPICWGKTSQQRGKTRKATARCKADFRALLPRDSSSYSQPSPEISQSRAKPFSCWGRLHPPSTTILGLPALFRSIVKKKRGRVPFFAKRRCASAQSCRHICRYICICRYIRRYIREKSQQRLAVVSWWSHGYCPA